VQFPASCDRCGGALGHGQKLLNPKGGKSAYLFTCPTCSKLNWRDIPEPSSEPETPPVLQHQIPQEQQSQQEQQAQQQQQKPDDKID
jgi:hypothetical protein